MKFWRGDSRVTAGKVRRRKACVKPCGTKLGGFASLGGEILAVEDRERRSQIRDEILRVL